jgi:hypothetical protein
MKDLFKDFSICQLQAMKASLKSYLKHNHSAQLEDLMLLMSKELKKRSLK